MTAGGGNEAAGRPCYRNGREAVRYGLPEFGVCQVIKHLVIKMIIIRNAG
jgi:hypothetical protein